MYIFDTIRMINVKGVQFLMSDNSDKELKFAMAVNESGLKIQQFQDQVKAINDKCHDEQMKVATKETAALKLDGKLLWGLDDLLLKALTNSNCDDFRVLEAITQFECTYASDVRHLGQYWKGWYQALLYYRYFLIQRKFSGANCLRVHNQFVKWLGDTIGQDNYAYPLAKAYNTWYFSREATVTDRNFELDE